MSWDVVFTDQFGDWWTGLSMEQQEAVYARVQVLMQLGPDLGRPVVDSIEGSKHGNMKELRASQGGALRACSCSIRSDAPCCCSAATRAVGGMSGT